MGAGVGVEKGPDTVSARELLDKLKKQNSTVDSLKGIGTITLRKNSKVQFKERLAWIGARPASFLIVVLASGHPVMKLSGNGRYIFYQNPYDQENAYRKIKSRDPSLKKFISVPLKASDLLSLLAGRIPITAYYSAELILNPDKDGKILVLKKWRRIREKIYLPYHGIYPDKIEIFKRNGTLNYRVQLERTKVVEGYRVPMKITVEAIEKDGPVLCQLSIDQYWPNVSVDPSQFILQSVE